MFPLKPGAAPPTPLFNSFRDKLRPSKRPPHEQGGRDFPIPFCLSLVPISPFQFEAGPSFPFPSLPLLLRSCFPDYSPFPFTAFTLPSYLFCHLAVSELCFLHQGTGSFSRPSLSSEISEKGDFAILSGSFQCPHSLPLFLEVRWSS